MKKKLMIAATITALAGLFAPVLVFTSFAQETTQVQSVGIDYSPAELFHSKFSVMDKGRPRIAFDAVRKNAGPYLESYVEYLSGQNVDGLNADDQLAYWLNVQNIVAIQAISFDAKKKSNLKKLRGTGEEPGKLWTTPRFAYGDKTLSLVDIENHIVRISDNPNVLYGIYQGVRGGPRLHRKAFSGATVRATLEEAGQTYVNSRGIVDTDNQTAKLTPVFTWHKDALFDGNDTQLIAHLRSHAFPRLSANLQRAKTVETVKLSYRVDAYKAPRPQRPTTYSSGTGSSGGGGYGS